MKWKAKTLIVLLVCSMLVATVYVVLASDDSALAKVHRGIELEFAEVSHIGGDDLSTLNKKGIVLFDVRDAPEFTVSHLKDAIRVDPAISAQHFVEKYSDIAKGKTVIFYCSVGQRSSNLANRVQAALISSGANAAYNLEGGIFKWHNERRPLYASSAKLTKYVHPYSPIWGSMVENQKYTRY